MFKRKVRLTEAEQMLNYMKEKYQEEFTPGLCETANWAYHYDSMTVYSDKFPKEFIQVYRYEKKIFKDNYLSYLFREEIEKLVQDITEPLFGRCKVILQVSNFPVEGNLGKDASIIDYLKNCPPTNRLNIYVEKFNPAEYDYDLGIENLRLQFKEKLLPQTIDFLFLKPEKDLDEITRESENHILRICDDDEDPWFEKEASFSFYDNYDFDESEFGQL